MSHPIPLVIITRAEAKALGLKRYFTGKPCSRKHVSERWTSNGKCYDCSAVERADPKTVDYQKRYKTEHAEEFALYQSEYNNAHPGENSARAREWVKNNYERHLETNAAWDKANPGRIKAAKAKSYQENRDVLLAEMAARYAENPYPARLRSSLWAKNNPDRMREHGRKRRALKLGICGSHTEVEVLVLFDIQKQKCANCKSSIRKKFHRDHIIAISKGGNDSIKNIQLLCPTCNLRKHAKDPIRWARENGRLL